MIEYPLEPGTPVSHLPFSPATRVGEFVFVSGQASVDGTGKFVPGTFEEQVRLSIENLRKVLETAGSDLAHVVQTRNYVHNSADVAEFNRIYPEYFKAPFPARTTITNCLGTLLYEIDCIAVVKGAKA